MRKIIISSKVKNENSYQLLHLIHYFIKTLLFVYMLILLYDNIELLKIDYDQIRSIAMLMVRH